MPNEEFRSSHTPTLCANYRKQKEVSAYQCETVAIMSISYFQNKLTHLYLRKNKITSEGAAMLAKAMETNKVKNCLLL